MKRLALAFSYLLFFVWACAGPTQVMRTRIETADGAMYLRHYRNAENPAVVIIGSPGISSQIFDVPAYGGLATFLYADGFDVWVVDWGNLPRVANRKRLSEALGAAIRYVGEKSNRRLCVIAHSLGGVLAIDVSARPEIERYVFIAVPGRLAYPLDPIAAWANQPVAMEPRSLRELLGTEGRPGTRGRLLDALLWSGGVEPLRPDVLETFLLPVGPALLQELQEAIRIGGWGSAWEARLAALNAPATVLVGQADALAPPWQTYSLYQRLGSVQKRYQYFSRGMGENREYGHLSILVGEGARREVYPVIAEALQ